MVDKALNIRAAKLLIKLESELTVEEARIIANVLNMASNRVKYSEPKDSWDAVVE